MGSKITKIAKVFMSGRSQAVRLPKEYRFDTDEVYVTRQGQNIIISPKKQHGTNFLILNQPLTMIS